MLATVGQLCATGDYCTWARPVNGPPVEFTLESLWRDYPTVGTSRKERRGIVQVWIGEQRMIGGRLRGLTG